MSSLFKPTPKKAPHRCSRLALTGLVLLITGLACLGWVAYQYVGTNAVSEHAFRMEKSQLRYRWRQTPSLANAKAAAPAKALANAKAAGNAKAEAAAKAKAAKAKAAAKADPKPGANDPRDTVVGSVIPSGAFALLRIPAFGDDYEVPILSGTDPGVLSRGVGHYSSTAMPGQVGNFAVAGHRVTHGQPFARLLELNKGDKIVVETRTAIYSYTLDVAPRDLTVESSDGWVLNPVPGKNTAPTKSLLTLTTCQDLFRSRDRSIGFGHLTTTTKK